MTYFMALLITLSALFTGPTQAPHEALAQAPTQAIEAPLTAPLTALTYEAPAVTTSPAPAPIQALPEAPAQAPYVAPAPAPIAPAQALPEAPKTVIPEAPAQAPTQAPERPTAAPGCMEDMPCWDCTVNDDRKCVNGVPQAPVSCPADFYKFATGECVDPYSGNVVQDCEAQGLVTAEDYTCAPREFWDEK